MLHYNYIYFDTGSMKNGEPNKDDYFYICTADLRSKDVVKVITYPLDYLKSNFLHKLFVLLHVLSLKFKTSLFERAFYPFYFKDNKSSKPYCFIVSGFYITPWYIKYLKKNYPDCKIIKIYRDSYILWRKRNRIFSDEDMKLFDMSFSYDIGESQKFNMIHFNEIESKIDVPIADNYPICDIFFAGAAKDRLSMIIEIYDMMEQNGLKCYFYITNAKPGEKVSRPGVVYADSWMTYKEMLYWTVNSRIILEINQGNIDGYTSRFLEAVIYNKKLITNNFYVKNNPFYDEKLINCFSDIHDIDISFVKSDSNVQFNYKDEFSPVHLIEFIDKTIQDKNV